MITQLITDLFEEKYVLDRRLPSLSFEVASYNVDFFAPVPLYFVQGVSILLFQMAVCCLLSVVMYCGIVRNKKPWTTSTQGVLVGYGLIIPLSLWLPFRVINWLDIRNVGYRLAFGCLPLTTTLCCLEAMHGCVPPPATESLSSYIVHTGFILRPKYDDKGRLVKSTMESISTTNKMHFVGLAIFALLFHLAEPFDFSPFPSTRPSNEIFVTLELGQMYNTFIQALMLNMTLFLSMYGVSALGSVLTGFQFNETMTSNPMFLSSSPSDFWGRRWNNLIHSGLKQGVYKPIRWNTGNKHLAAFAAFFASGIIHEYMWALWFFNTDAEKADPDCTTCYHAIHGKQLLFFGWNGILIVLEYLLADRLAFLKAIFPRLVTSHLVVLLSLPVGHLFAGDMTLAGYFKHFQVCLPVIKATPIA